LKIDGFGFWPRRSGGHKSAQSEGSGSCEQNGHKLRAKFGVYRDCDSRFHPVDGVFGSSPEKPPDQAQLIREAEERSRQENEAAEESTSNTRAAMGGASIIAAARNPESVKFESVGLLKDETVCYRYRAQNGFGGMNREFAVLLPKGKNLQTSSSAWNLHCANREGTDITYFVTERAALFARQDDARGGGQAVAIRVAQI
jgi:hypothetical protein